MADTQSNIKVSIDTTDALASIKNLQRQISAFHTSMAKSGAAANAVTGQMQQNLVNSINATGKFSAQMKTIKTTTESFTDSLQKNKFSLGEYFRYAGGASKSFGKLFKTEFDTINKVARENVKDLQTQYIKMGRDANGAMKAIAVRPLSLDMNDLATKTMIASEKQALLNQLLKQGSTNLLNFGKNTQWAGRQLMVGFTIPLLTLGSAASKTFMDMEQQAIRFKKVYGDLFTPKEETAQALKEIQDLGKEFTKYGIAVSDTVGLASEAAAAGFKGLDLQRQTTAATKLAILGQVESQKALETTIALQNAFSMSSDNLATSIDFLNAVENQTVLSLDDMSTAIPKAAPIIQQLGGDVKDLAFFMTAMKEGGINASEGANAIKSGLASIINPTGKASAMLESFGINVKKIVVDNKGDLKKTVIDFATALNQLDPLNRAQAIEQMFGKFQFARLSTLFSNVTKEGTQAARVLDLAGSSVQDLAALSEKELGMTSESAMNKFKASVENLKLALVPLGEQFLKAVTPVAEFVTKILDKFNGLGDGTKRIIVTLTAIVAGLGPVLLMTFGLLANGIANIIKGFTAVKSLFNKTGQSSATLGTEVKYMTLEQRNAAAVAASLDQVHKSLAQTFTSERAAVDALTRAYQRAIATQAQFMPTSVPLARGPISKRAKGKPAVVGGTGNKDSELALLMPGETVIPTEMSNKYGSLINAMIADKVPGYAGGLTTQSQSSVVASHFDITAPSELAQTIAMASEELGDFAVSVYRVTKDIEGNEYEVRRTTERLADIGSEENVDVLAGGRTFGGTTTLGQGSRNQMFNALGIKGEPFTLDALIKAGEDAQSALENNTVDLDKYSEELEILAQEGRTASQMLQNSNDATGEKISYMNTNAKQAITESILADARIKIDGKRVTVAQAQVIAEQRLAQVNAEIAQLRADGVDEEVLLQRAQAKYAAALLKSGTGDVAVGPSGTGGGVTRDVATGRGRNILKRIGAIGGERKFAYGGRTANGVKAAVTQSFTATGEELITTARNALVSAARRALRIQSPSAETHDIGVQVGKGLSNGIKESIPDATVAGQEIGKSVVSGARQSYRPQGPAPIGPEAPAGATMLPIVSAPTERDIVKTRRAKRRQALLNKTKSVGSKFSGRGVGIGLSSAAMMGSSMLPAKIGDLVNKVAMAGFAFSALKPMIMSLVAAIGAGPLALIAGVGLLTIGLLKLNKSSQQAAKEIQDSAKREAEARYGSARAVQQFAKTFNKALPSEREFSRNNKQSIAASGQQVSSFAKDYASKDNISAQIITQAGLKSKESGVSAIAMDVAQKAAVFGLSPDDIAANIKAASDLIGADQVQVKLAVQQLLSPDGKDILKEPLTVQSRIEFLNKNNKKQIESIKKSILDVSKLGNASAPQSIAMTIAKNTATSAAIGGAAGSFIPGAGTGVGAITGFGAGLVKSIPAILNASKANEEYKKSQKTIQATTVQLSIAFMQQKESLALLNSQYADGLISQQEYDAQMLISRSNFNNLEKSSKTLINQLRKIDGTGALAAAAVKDLGDQALGTLKKSNPALFDKITKSFEGLSNSAKINIYMGYAQGSLTIMDLALIPEILEKINGKEFYTAIKIIADSELSSGAKGTLSVPLAETELKAAEAAAKKQKTLDAAKIKRVSDARIALAKAKKQEEDAAKVNQTGKLDTDNVNNYKDIVDGAGKAETASEKYLKILQKEIDALEAKRDAQKKANDEVQRQIDLQNKLQDLASQAVNAKISGNYIQAAALGQQSVQVQGEFDRQTSLNKDQDAIDVLIARKKAIEDGAKLTAAEKAKIPRKANGGLIKGPGTGRSDSITAKLGYAGGGSIRVSNGEFVVKASSVRDYGLNAMNAVNNGTATIGTNSGGTVYNISMPITSNNSDPKAVGDYVIKQLKIQLDKNNTSNRVNI